MAARFSGSLSVALLIAISAIPGAGAYVRTDVVDENYLTGYLYWENGKGGIAWNEPHASEDDVDPGNDSVEFLSAPIPQTLYLNVSRVFQLDLFFQGTSKVAVDAELSVGQAFVAGGLHGYNDGIYYCPTSPDKTCADPSSRPSASGYTVASHRMQGELDTIPKGAVLLLRSSIRNSNEAHYGMTGDHASVLRIPVFSPDEALYRVPKYSYPNPATGPGPPVPSLDPVTEVLNHVLNPGTAGGAALVPFTLLRGPRHRKPRLAALLVSIFAVAAVAGCAGNPPRPDSDASAGPGLGGSASNYIVPDSNNETGLVSTTRGSLYGVVSDIDGLPVNGAHVALLGIARSARTDPYGRFHFNDLQPDTYRVRIDRDGFKPYEGTVQVEAASITKLEVVLEFVVVKDVTQRPHRHDAWFDAKGKPIDSFVLLDNAAPFYQDGSGYSAWNIPESQLVSPGTVDVEFNFTWPGGSSVLLSVGVPNDPYNVTYLYPRESGRAFHLRTTWEMTDPGHSIYSYWRGFVVRTLGVPCEQYTLGSGDPRCPANFDPLGLPGTPSGFDTTANPYGFHVRVTLHKGVVPLEPAHPDRWGASQVFPVIANETQELVDYCSLRCPTGAAYNASWAVRSFVPFETQWLDVTLRASRSFAGAGAAPWRFFSRDAETSNGGTCYAPYNRGSREAQLHSQDPPGLSWTWRIPVTALGADRPYAKSSNWCFFAAPVDQNAYMVDDYEQRYGPGQTAKLTLTLSVDAHRDPLPKS